MDYYAHSHEGAHPKDWHKLSKHLIGASDKAAAFLDAIGLSDFGRAAGLLHDLGKYTPEFQNRLAGSHERVNHSTAGAKVAIERYGERIGKLIAFSIAGHHAGLANGVNGDRTTALQERLCEKVLTPDPVWGKEIDLPPELSFPPLKPPSEKDAVGLSISILIRMIFSALVDADYLDTEAWFTEMDGKTKSRGQYPPLSELRSRLSAYLHEHSSNARPGLVNDWRQKILMHAREKSAELPGMFSLTVPTGGGKTLTSLAFALDHAARYGLDRVIYVIPYTSIVEQTAAVFRTVLSSDRDNEDNLIIEHHSTFDEERITRREAKDKLRLAMENWDAPIIVTTAVQFFESLFANRTSRCRKLHNIANSVVILDEAQTLPLKYLRPCVAALDELARNWRTSVVLCTATQPALRKIDGFPGGLDRVRELAPEPSRIYETLKRTKITHQGTLTDEELAMRLESAPQVLCIVNTRRHARELYESMQHLKGALHLTTLMCARHRSECLDTVRARLKNGEAVRLIATSLVEAGVDLDFPFVWRAESGLESIIQAAGRCNREGREAMGDVFVFQPAPGEGRKPPPEIEKFAAAARSIIRKHDDPMALEAIRNYFRELYWLEGNEALDTKNILRRLNEQSASLDFPFENIADDFRFIETAMVPVVIPWKGYRCNDHTAEHLIESLRWTERPGGIARRLQPFLVQIPRKARAELLATGSAEAIRESEFGMQFIALSNQDIYTNEIGLSWDDPTFRRSEGLVM